MFGLEGTPVILTVRQKGEETLYSFFNFSDLEHTVSLPAPAACRDLLTGRACGVNAAHLMPGDFVWLLQSSEPCA